MSSRQITKYGDIATVTRLRQYRPEDEKDLFEARVDTTISDIIKLAKIVQPYLDVNKKAKIINALDPDLAFRSIITEAAKPTEKVRQTVKVEETIPGETTVLFPYASEPIFNRVKTLMKDVEYIRSIVMEDNELFTDDEGRSTVSVRDLSSFVGAINTLYTTVGNLEGIEKIRKDIQSITHAIGEAVTGLPPGLRAQFMADFKHTLERINER